MEEMVELWSLRYTWHSQKETLRAGGQLQKGEKLVAGVGVWFTGRELVQAGGGRKSRGLHTDHGEPQPLGSTWEKQRDVEGGVDTGRRKLGGWGATHLKGGLQSVGRKME